MFGQIELLVHEQLMHEMNDSVLVDEGEVYSYLFYSKQQINK